MDTHIKVLGVLYIVFSCLGLLAALALFTTLTGAGLLSGDYEAIAITSFIGSVGAFFLLIVSAPGIIGGWGLLQRSSWARILVLILGFLNLLNFPFGTALGIYTIWALLNKDAAKLFR